MTLDLSEPLTRSRKKQKTSGNTTGTTPSATVSPLNTIPQTNHDREQIEIPISGTERQDDIGAQERIQIIDLHKENPIISYQNQIYTCQWATTIGTDLLLVSPSSDCPLPVLSGEKGFAVLATAGIKLVGRPVQLVPRLDVRNKKTPNNSILIPDDHLNPQNGIEPHADDHIHIPVRADESRAKHNQARFLERLIAVKTIKGESDLVTVHTRKNPGTGWRSRFQDAEPTPLLNGQTGVRKEDSDLVLRTNGEARAPNDGGNERPQGRNIRKARGRSSKRAVGGLFRDYRPTAGDTEGADIRGIPDSTLHLGQSALPMQNEYRDGEEQQEEAYTR